MRIKSVQVNNFRCFGNERIECDDPFVILQGKNGAGKTSLLEAIHYGCYLRSFRTHSAQELIKIGEKHFFIKIIFDHQAFGDEYELTIGYSPQEGRLVKLNKKPIHSYKELISLYRVITLTTDDIALVAGTPEKRRSFLDFSLLLQDPGLTTTFRRYRTIVDQRNAVLKQMASNQRYVLTDELETWTLKLREESSVIQQTRITYLHELEAEVNKLIQNTGLLGEQLEVHLTYEPTKLSIDASLSDNHFLSLYQNRWLQQELAWRRGLFGAHLEDFSISFHQKRARIFASRGQQKIITFLIKIAQLSHLITKYGMTGILLLDDFLTDLDEKRIHQCLQLLIPLQTQGVQIFVAHPLAEHGFLGFDKITGRKNILSL